MSSKTVFAVIAVLLIGIAVYFGLSGEKGDIMVGGKNFTEQTIIGEMAAQLIEARTDLAVVRQFQLGTNLPMKLIQSGELDLYLDYTGTGYVDILGIPYNQESREEIYRSVKEAYPEKFGADWLSPLGFDNTYTLTMRDDQAEELGIEKISDLEAHVDELTAGFDPAFLDRSDGYPGLAEHYGFKFAEEPSQLAIGLMYKACQEGQVDVIDAFSTDGRIEKFDLRILDDDRKFFPPYDAAFVVREETLQEHPEVGKALELLAGEISTEAMQKLNYSVDQEERSAKNVAREFLVSHGLIDAGENEG
jgi:glycine betaine/choline ABC-type transport system substrate-binding protein